MLFEKQLRNNWLLALFIMGEGWHNNHHAYQSSARQGFRCWKIDLTYYLLMVLSWLGIVWELKRPPNQVIRNEQRPGKHVIMRAAEQLAARFDPEHIARTIGSSVQETGLSLQDALFQLQKSPDWRSPSMPTRDQLFAEVREMFAKTRSLDAIVE